MRLLHAWLAPLAALRLVAGAQRFMLRGWRGGGRAPLAAWRPALLACLLFALASPGARAEEIRIGSVEIAPADEALVLDADFEFEFTTRLEDALKQGIPLYFVIEFDLTQILCSPRRHQ